MAWLGKVSLGNFSDIAGAVSNFGDIAGAVTKFSESVKNIEKNFDSALGFDEKSKAAIEAQTLSGEKELSLDPSLALAGQQDSEMEPSQLDAHYLGIRSREGAQTSSDNLGLSKQTNSTAREDDVTTSCEVDDGALQAVRAMPLEGDFSAQTDDAKMGAAAGKTLSSLREQGELDEGEHIEGLSAGNRDTDGAVGNELGSKEEAPMDSSVAVYLEASGALPEAVDGDQGFHQEAIDGDQGPEAGHACEEAPTLESDLTIDGVLPAQHLGEASSKDAALVLADQKALSTLAFRENNLVSSPISSVSQELPPIENEGVEVENLKAQMKMLDAALQGAAYQSKVKADELSRLAIENDNLRSLVEDLKRKSSDGELDAMREEFQQRLSAAERKVYALTKERDMLRREQNRKDVSVLLKEKDEIIKQVMAEGEELSKKQAAQEAQMRKLRAQIRELEEEKQRLKSKLQVEEATVESLRKDKAATEKALQEAVEKTQVELAIQKEFYTNALNEAKEAEARAGARADTEAKLELERRLLEAGERETALVQAIEEVRQVLSRASYEAASREDMLQRDIEDLQKRCQAADLRYEELVASVPESTRPLLRQIEALRESTALRAEAWSGAERALNARLQEAEAKAAASQERERAINERLTQTLSRMAVLEAQVSCLKAEQAQLTRSLEKERQRASENRQQYLAALESAATHEGHAKQLEVDLKELRSRIKRELAEERTIRELLQQELEREKKKRIEHESMLGNGTWSGVDSLNASPAQVQVESGASRSLRRFSSVSSGGSLEEGFYLQASLDAAPEQAVSDGRRSSTPQSYAPRGVFSSTTVEQLEALLYQREGEISLYTSRLDSLESTRDALAEELVKATTQCEKFRTEVASLPGMRAELESLRRRHTSALELMGERDEQVEELKADLADVKQMYREQIDMLVNQIEKLSVALSGQ